MQYDSKARPKVSFSIKDRVIMHVDMDAFYAAVEELDDPTLRGKPVIVGAKPKDGRGVVSTANYVARKFGLHSAQPISEAYRLCPEGIYLYPRFSRYKEISDKVFEILNTISPSVEPISIDEAFVDLTGTQRLLGDPVETGRRVKERILKTTGLVASIGIAPNKFLAKLASDHDKPNGFVVIEKDRVRQFLNKLPIRDLWGVGPSTEQALAKLGITTVEELSRTPIEVLKKRLGEHGESLWRLCRGIDDRPVSPGGGRKGISKETTYHKDVTDFDRKKSTLRYIADKLAARMRDKGISGRTITVKIRYTGWTTITRSDTLPNAISTSDEIYREALRLALPELEGSIRLLGIRMSNIAGEEVQQMPLFGRDEIDKTKRLERALDSIHDKFGDKSIDRAKSIRDRENRE